MHRTVVLDVVGLTRSLVGARTPRLASFTEQNAEIEPITPALTCSVQATYTTGVLPSAHGIVGNGWYFRDLNEIWLWRQSNRLVQAPKLWEAAAERDEMFSCATTFWWYAMATGADISLTPRPLYLADGRKLPDLYSDPPELRDEFNRDFGTFPLFDFWGPRTSIRSSEWIAKAAVAVEERFRPSLQLVYLPHLDYVLQRVGPDGKLDRDLREIDEVCGRLLDLFLERGLRVIVLSEYAIAAVNRPVHPNRILREAGYLAVKVDLDREYLDPGRSRAFAVSDHQVAHVYIDDPRQLDAVRALFEATPGVGAVLGEQGKKAAGLDHERAGELVLLAEDDSWFTYYFWLDDARAPDYARTVDIHNKPGFDPCELFVDPGLRLPGLRAGWTLARKALGLRYTMELTPLDPSLVRGSHGLARDTSGAMPLVASSEPRLIESDRMRATSVRDLILGHLFSD